MYTQATWEIVSDKNPSGPSRLDVAESRKRVMAQRYLVRHGFRRADILDLETKDLVNLARIEKLAGNASYPREKILH